MLLKAFLLLTSFSGALAASTEYWSSVYEIRRNAERIGHIHFIGPDVELRTRTLDVLRRVFEPTAVEEQAGAEKIGFTGIRYYFGKGGEARFVLTLSGIDLRAQEKKSSELMRGLDMDIVYRGNLLVNYWIKDLVDTDLGKTRHLPLNLAVGNDTLSIKVSPVPWSEFKATRALRVMYRGAPGEIVHLGAPALAQPQASAEIESIKGLMLSKGQALFSVPGLTLPEEKLSRLFELSDADCAWQGQLTEYVHCFHQSLQRNPEAQSDRLTFAYRSGSSEISLPPQNAGLVFDLLVKDTRPTFAYGGERIQFLSKAQKASLLSPDRSELSDPAFRLSSRLLNYRVDLLRDGQTIASARFWGVNEITRTRIVQHLREQLLPHELRIVQLESARKPAADGSVADASEGKVIGIYYENELNWFDRVALRYTNKTALTVQAGFERYDYQIEAPSSLSYLARNSTSVLSFLSFGGAWYPTHSFWGVEGGTRFAFVKHGSSLSGLLYKIDIAPTLRFYFSEAKDSPQLKFSLGFHADGDSVGSNAVLGSATLVDFPLRLAYTHTLFERFHLSAAFSYSPLMFVMQDFSAPVAGSSSGYRVGGRARLAYDFADTMYTVFSDFGYERSQFAIGGNSATRTELGGQIGLALRWE